VIYCGELPGTRDAMPSVGSASICQPDIPPRASRHSHRWPLRSIPRPRPAPAAIASSPPLAAPGNFPLMRAWLQMIRPETGWRTAFALSARPPNGSHRGSAALSFDQYPGAEIDPRNTGTAPGEQSQAEPIPHRFVAGLQSTTTADELAGSFPCSLAILLPEFVEGNSNGHFPLRHPPIRNICPKWKSRL